MGRFDGIRLIVPPNPSAVALAAEGAAVLVAGADPVAVAGVVAAVRAAGGRAHGYVGSASDAAAGEMAAELFPTCEPAEAG